jgi:hypothetical protein
VPRQIGVNPERFEGHELLLAFFRRQIRSRVRTGCGFQGAAMGEKVIDPRFPVVPEPAIEVLAECGDLRVTLRLQAGLRVADLGLAAGGGRSQLE